MHDVRPIPRHPGFDFLRDESNAPFFKWFHDGELNASYNCLDRHLKTQADKTAIIFEADDGKVTRVSYKELYHKVCQLANALKKLNVQDGERIGTLAWNTYRHFEIYFAPMCVSCCTVPKSLTTEGWPSVSPSKIIA